MKNNKYILSFAGLALLMPLALLGCANQGESDEITPILLSLEKGFTLNGTVTQSRKISNISMDGTVTPQGEPESQDYRVEVLYENSDTITGSSITQYGKLGEVETIIDQLNAFVDEDGYCYQEFLNHKNEVEVKKLKEFDNQLSFASAGLYNFVSILNSHDFTYNDQLGLYQVDINKMGLIFANMLGRINAGFYHTPISVTVGVENGMFDTLEVIMENYHTTTFEEDHYVEVQYLNSATFTFDKVGETKLEHVKPVDAKPENFELRKALDKIGDNFTLDMKSEIAQDGGEKHKTYRYMKFSGEKIMIQDYENSFQKDKLKVGNHFILQPLKDSQRENLYCYVMVDNDTKEYQKSATGGFAKNYQGIYFYEDLLPTPKEISTDFFTSDETAAEFICDDGEIVSRLTPLLTINKAPIKNDHILNAQKVGIRLDDDGNVSYFKFYVNYQDLFNGTTYSGEIKVTLSNVGGTEI